MVDVVSQIVMVPIDQIRPYERNVRKNDNTVKPLAELITKVGFNVPLVLDRQNVIVKGHTRWKAGRHLKMKTLPCVYTDNDEETNKLDRLADNKVQELSLWNMELLGSELAGLNLSFNFDIGVLGFKLDLPTIDVSQTAPASRPPALGPDTSSDEEQDSDDDDTEELTAADLVDIKQPDYLEVLCDHCGHKFYVRKP
jgi:ParB-like chromosome segregation protein Spo0J